MTEVSRTRPTMSYPEALLPGLVDSSTRHAWPMTIWRYGCATVMTSRCLKSTACSLPKGSARSPHRCTRRRQGPNVAT